MGIAISFVNALNNVERLATGDKVPVDGPCPNAGTRVVEVGGSRPNYCVTKMNNPIAGSNFGILKAKHYSHLTLRLT